MIENISDIIALAQDGFTDWKSLGHVYTKQRGPLMLFNYLPSAAYERQWSYFERVSRGLIINVETGEVVARPFDKFFNWFEDGRYSKGHIVNIAEKIDGSLGIQYREGGQVRIATRGSFDGDQALWASEFIKKKDIVSWLPDELTLLYEIVYPENRIVVDYKGREDLVLLAIRNRVTGAYLPFFPDTYGLARACKLSLPQTYPFNNVTEIMIAAEKLDINSEGWVVEFSDGQRFKFKGEQYKELHRLVTGLSFNKTLQAIRDGTIDNLLDVVPDEFLAEVRDWMAEINAKVNAVMDNVHELFELAPKSSRKEFALWVMSEHKDVAVYLFAMLDGEDVEPLILQHEFN